MKLENKIIIIVIIFISMFAIVLANYSFFNKWLLD